MSIAPCILSTIVNIYITYTILVHITQNSTQFKLNKAAKVLNMWSKDSSTFALQSLNWKSLKLRIPFVYESIENNTGDSAFDNHSGSEGLNYRIPVHWLYFHCIARFSVATQSCTIKLQYQGNTSFFLISWRNCNDLLKYTGIKVFTRYIF